MDSYYNYNFGQDLQDLPDSFISQFPDETEKTQSDFVGNEHIFKIAIFS